MASASKNCHYREIWRCELSTPEKKGLRFDLFAKNRRIIEKPMASASKNCH
jgi:hypothetical protein